MIHRFFKRRQKAFTVIELMVSLTILGMISMGAARIYMNYTASSRDLKASNLVYQEARFLMERIVREVRQNAVDYEGYFTMNVLKIIPGTDPVHNENYSEASYEDYYCWYDLTFYDGGSDGDIFTDLSDSDSTGERIMGYKPAISYPIQDELMLINIPGDTKTVIKRMEEVVGGNTLGKVKILRLEGEDFGSDRFDGVTPSECSPDLREGDGLIDTWRCADSFTCEEIETPGPGLCEGNIDHATDDSFVSISPNAINITNLRFIVTPEDDPWKAYANNNVQIQPHVTIQMTVEANPDIVSLTNNRKMPAITLTSTASTRNYDEIKSPCGSEL